MWFDISVGSVLISVGYEIEIYDGGNIPIDMDFPPFPFPFLFEDFDYLLSLLMPRVK